MMRLAALTFILLPFMAAAENAPENYGIGLLCPKADTQVTFYTENDQQDAAGTIAFENGGGLIVMSDHVKDLKSGGAETMDSMCEGGVPGIRIEAKRDGWLQAGKMWFPPNLEWEYADWQDFLRKSTVWKPLVMPVLFEGNQDGPQKTNAYPETNGKIAGIYPLKFTDDYSFALVLLDESGAYAKACAGEAVAPKGRMGWMRLSEDDGKPLAVPLHIQGCAVR